MEHATDGAKSIEGDDAVMAALDDLAVAAVRTVHYAQLIVERAERVREARAEGLPYAEIVAQQPRPLMVELVSASFAELSAAGSRWRREAARALHREGLSTQAIAEIFGVSRQRVSALINAPRPPD